MSDASRTTDWWGVSLRSNGVAYVRGHIFCEQTVDTLIVALRKIEPLLPARANSEIDGEWAE